MGIQVYESHDRANLAYRWAFPDVMLMPESFTPDDGEENCESAVMYFLSIIDEADRSHPYKKRYRSLQQRVIAFNTRYPL